MSPRTLLGITVMAAAPAMIAACASVLGIEDRRPLREDAGLVSGTNGDDAATSGDGMVSLDAGPPQAALSADAIDFGLVPCGTSPANRTLTLTNIGGAPLSWRATLASTAAFSFVGANAGVIAQAQSATVVVASLPIPSFVGAGDTQQTVLTIESSDPARPTTELAVRATAAGGLLSLVPLAASFGELPAGKPANDIPLVLANAGNLPVTVALVQPTNTQFTLAWTGSPAAITLAPGAQVPGLVARFTPASGSNGTLVSSAPVSITNGATCGVGVNAIAFEGTATSGTVAVQPGLLDFGAVDCGQQAAAKSFTLTNFGSAPFDWSIAPATPAAYTISPTSGTALAPNASATITVSPKPIPAASAVTPDLYGQTLTVTTTAAGDAPHPVVLRETARGAILTTSAPDVTFGATLIGATASSQVTVSNAGNAPATVSFTSSDSVFALTPQAQVVSGGSSYAVNVAFKPTAATAFAATAAMTVAPGTVLCRPVPNALTLNGTGTTSNAVTATPTSLDFGLVDCGTAASARTVTIANSTTAGITWSASIATTFYGISPASGTIASGQTAAVTVTPVAVPSTSATTADLYADTLTITTNAPGDAAHLVALHETARGVVLSWNRSSSDLGGVSVGSSANETYTLSNQGNVAGAVTYATGSAQFMASPTSSTLASNGAANVSVTFAPTSTGTKNATLTVTTSAPRCAPLPTMALTGLGE